MGFGGAHNSLLDERPLAKSVAAQYGCFPISRVCDTVRLRAIVGEIVAAFDEPFAGQLRHAQLYVQLTGKRPRLRFQG